ncbi:MAG: type II/IV secretion system protein [Candidatus Brennerbacteria bacterium]|nr:type II/IV secretion system protein [Candidatus Brennerbacteria bacterium]
MLKFPKEKLKEIIVKEGFLKPEEFDRLDEEAGRKQQNVADILISQGLITQEYLYGLVAKALGFERFNVNIQKIDEAVLNIIPEEIARRYRVIIFNRELSGILDAAMEDPANIETLEFLEKRFQAKFKPFLATEEELNRGFALYEAKLAKDFKQVIEESVQKSMHSRSTGLEQAASELPIVAILDNLVSYAISSRASDIHMEIMENDFIIRYRIDGVLHEALRIPKEIHPAIVARVKLLSGLRIDEHSRPQDGRFRYKISGDLMDVRVSVMPVFYGEKVEMRLLPAAQKPLSLEDVGLLPNMVAVAEENFKKTYGMFLVCGPTGAGKTTTLYSVLSILNKPEVNIVTIEDPVEYDMRYVNQTQVNVAAGITFANGLRAILRQDPNVIMVGEIRDEETASIAVQSALTGHLVLSSLHTNDAATAIPRLIDMKIPPFLTAAVLNAVIAQRLVRRIHNDCIESYTISEAEEATIRKQLVDLGINPDNFKFSRTFYRGKGCMADNFTGYLGRVGIFEILNVTEEIRKLIIDPELSLDAINKKARENGMITMFEDGLRKIELGLTTLSEVLRVIRE